MRVGYRKVGYITVDVKSNVNFVEFNGRIGLGHYIIQKLGNYSVRFSS